MKQGCILEVIASLIILITIVGLITFTLVYVGTRAPQCLLSNDPITCATIYCKK